ncbi:hypothetical protein [Pseudomonas sp. 58 R 3]|nr:hypothetical protein [Pseudomonas sp. 58 R 3]
MTDASPSSFSKVGHLRPRSRVLRYVRLLMLEKSSWVSLLEVLSSLSA